MNKYYKDLMDYGSEEHNQALIEGIDPSQRGNASFYPNDITDFPVSLDRVDKNADLIGAGLFSEG